MKQRRSLHLADADAVAAEVRRLRRGCKPIGNWSFPQVCWHLNIAMRRSMRPGPHEIPPPDPQAEARLKQVLQTGRLPDGVPAPEIALPPADASDAVVDDLLAALAAFKTFPGPFAPHRLFGVVPHEQYIRLQMIHCAHHLSYLEPAAG